MRRELEGVALDPFTAAPLSHMLVATTGRVHVHLDVRLDYANFVLPGSIPYCRNDKRRKSRKCLGIAFCVRSVCPNHPDSGSGFPLSPSLRPIGTSALTGNCLLAKSLPSSACVDSECDLLRSKWPLTTPAQLLRVHLSFVATRERSESATVGQQQSQ